MGSVQITQGTGTPIRTLNNAGVDSGAHQQVVSLADVDGDMLSSKLIPAGTEDALLVRSMPTQVARTEFSDVVASGVDPNWGTVVKTGSGQTVSQSNSNLIVTTGTTANSETIIRGTASFTGALRVRCRSTLSQRIANQNFYVELVDVIGDNLAITISSATAVTVTFPTTNPFNVNDVGKSMYLGGYAGTGTFIPGRYALASISGLTATFTVAGFAAGSGTVCVFGLNYHHLIYNGTSATNALWDTQRNGWNSTDTTITTQSSATPGHLVAMTHNDMQAAVMDSLVASATGIQYTVRGSRIEKVPDNATLRLQLRIVNGSTAPASTTTWTVGAVAVSNWSPQDVTIQDVRPQPPTSALPVQIANTPSVNATLAAGSNSIGYIAANSGTAASPYFLETTAVAIAATIKAGSGNLFEITVSNLTAAAIWVKLYNKASNPIPASDTPLQTFQVAANSDRTLEYGVNGKRFSTGIALGITAAAAKTDTAVIGAGVQISASYV